jgi:small-conductance mechanosensitive channel
MAFESHLFEENTMPNDPPQTNTTATDLAKQAADSVEAIKSLTGLVTSLQKQVQELAGKTNQPATPPAAAPAVPPVAADAVRENEALKQELQALQKKFDSVLAAQRDSMIVELAGKNQTLAQELKTKSLEYLEGARYMQSQFRTALTARPTGPAAKTEGDESEFVSWDSVAPFVYNSDGSRRRRKKSEALIPAPSMEPNTGGA